MDKEKILEFLKYLDKNDLNAIKESIEKVILKNGIIFDKYNDKLSLNIPEPIEDKTSYFNIFKIQFDRRENHYKNEFLVSVKSENKMDAIFKYAEYLESLSVNKIDIKICILTEELYMIGKNVYIVNELKK